MIKNILRNSNKAFIKMSVFILLAYISIATGKFHSIYKRDSNDCIIPEDINYPECRNKILVEKICPCSIPNNASKACQDAVKWMIDEGLAKYSVYKEYGVEGSICSVLYYLSQVENKCPKENCKIPNSSVFPQCKNRFLWMQAYWKTNPFYKLKGVDGSKCSILNYLSKVERVCPCSIPINNNYPKCQEKLDWMVQDDNWKTDNYVKKGYNGSICSILTWLSKVERFCPSL
ncbi:uncharacterized protein LOC101237025 isoform X5 [Hydra vulgaris]|uniref:Uncharacterized protein LOC101237025 isoform X5 n=1 Tax=Hydra vulgaris TaxID=6087 RepID=A0ABM4CEY7_HYDVU